MRQWILLGIGISLVLVVTISVRLYLMTPTVTVPAISLDAGQTIDTSAPARGRVLPLSQ